MQTAMKILCLLCPDPGTDMRETFQRWRLGGVLLLWKSYYLSLGRAGPIYTVSRQFFLPLAL